jgi:hypothetical protein
MTVTSTVAVTRPVPRVGSLFGRSPPSPEGEAEMKWAGVADWRLELYGGIQHSFTNPAAD